jgi:hypothetical protein
MQPDGTGHCGRLALVLSAAILLAVCVPAYAQRQDFSGWEETPGLYFYLVQPAEAWQGGIPTVLCTVTRDRVSGPNALRLDFPDLAVPAGVVAYRPPGHAIASRLGYQGIVFWVKGDGSEGRGVIAVGNGKETDPRAFFSLSEKTWQPVRLWWSDFDRAVGVNQIESFTFGITPETKRPAYYVIDRIQLVREPKPSVEEDELRALGMKAAKDVDPARPTDLTKFVARGEKLAPVIELLNAKKPVRTLVVGDAQAQGSALWNVPAGVRDDYLFWGRLRRRLGGEDPAGNVRVIVAATPEEAVNPFAAALERAKPQLVVLAFSSASIEPGKLGVQTKNREALSRLIDLAARADATLLAVPVSPLPGPLKRLDTAGLLARAASDKDVALADFPKLIAARGPGWEGEYYATPDQLNIQGHWLLADLLTQALGQSKPEKAEKEDKE